MSVKAAFIVPHPPIIMKEIGKGEELAILKTINSYMDVAKKTAWLKPALIVLISPHGLCYSDYIHIFFGREILWGFGRFRRAASKRRSGY